MITVMIPPHNAPCKEAEMRVVFTLIMSASAVAPIGPILLPATECLIHCTLPYTPIELEHPHPMSITVRDVLTFRASDSAVAPASPMLFATAEANQRAVRKRFTLLLTTHDELRQGTVNH